MRFLKLDEYRKLLVDGVPENVDGGIGELFYENTKLKRRFNKYYGFHIENIVNTPYYVQRMLLPFKIYTGNESFKIKINTSKKTYLERIIEERRSPYEIEEHKMDFKILSNILYYSYGITKKKKVKIIDEWNNEIEVYYHYRPTPSAGGLYPHEIYLIILRLENFLPGIYHYNPFESTIEKVSQTYKLRVLEGKLEETFPGLPKAPWLVGVVIAAIPNRQVIKYFSRAYRFILIEAGHIAQNIMLLATSYKYGVLPIGGFYDDELIKLININEQNEIPIYSLFIGKPISKGKKTTPEY